MLTLAGATVLELATPIAGRLLNTPLLLFVTSRLHDALCVNHCEPQSFGNKGNSGHAVQH